MITFNIPGKPQAKQRPRHGNGFTYTPKETVAYENLVRLCYGNRPKLTGEIVADITFMFIKPKTSKYNYPTRADLDNCIKSVLDGLQKYAYENDSQVTELHCRKIYGSENNTVVTLNEK